MTILRATLLSALLLSLAGCVAYDPYYAGYPAGPVVVGPPVYAAPPPVVVYRDRPRPWRGPGWGYRSGWSDRGGWGHHGGGRGYGGYGGHGGRGR